MGCDSRRAHLAAVLGMKPVTPRGRAARHGAQVTGASILDRGARIAHAPSTSLGEDPARPPNPHVADELVELAYSTAAAAEAGGSSIAGFTTGESPV